MCAMAFIPSHTVLHSLFIILNHFIQNLCFDNFLTLLLSGWEARCEFGCMVIHQLMVSETVTEENILLLGRGEDGNSCDGFVDKGCQNWLAWREHCGGDAGKHET